MGYSVYGSGAFRFDPDHQADAYAALRTLQARDGLGWIDPTDDEAATTAIALLDACGLTSSTFTKTADGTEWCQIDFDGSGQEWHDDAAAAISPYVAEGTVEWEGEDGDHWRWRFENGRVYYDQGETTYTESAEPMPALDADEYARRLAIKHSASLPHEQRTRLTNAYGTADPTPDQVTLAHRMLYDLDHGTYSDWSKPPTVSDADLIEATGVEPAGIGQARAAYLDAWRFVMLSFARWEAQAMVRNADRAAALREQEQAKADETKLADAI